MTFGWPKKKSEVENSNSNLESNPKSNPESNPELKPEADENMKDGNYFFFSKSEKKSFAESVEITKDLQQRAKPLFYDQIPTLSGDEISDSLIASCMKVPEGKYDDVYAENVNTVLDSLMEYKKYEAAAEVLRRLDMSIPLNKDVKNRIGELKSYFKATDGNKESLGDLKRADGYYKEASEYRKEKSEIKKSTFDNLEDEKEKSAGVLDEAAIKEMVNNPGKFIKQVVDLPVSAAEKFFSKFEDNRLSQIGITESRRTIEEKINFMKDDIIKKLMSAGDYKKALYYFDGRTSNINADSLLHSFFSAAAKNNDTKTVKIIQQTANGMYYVNKFSELKEDIKEYLNLKESFNNSIIDSLNNDEKVDEYDKKKASIPDKRLNKVLIDEYNEAGTIRQS